MEPSRRHRARRDRHAADPAGRQAPGTDHRADPVARRLKAVGVALAQVAEAVVGERTGLRGAARLLREQLEAPAKAVGPLASQLGADFDQLSAPIARLADTLLAVSDEPDLTVPGGEHAACDVAVSDALARSRDRERTVLQRRLPGSAPPCTQSVVTAPRTS